MMTLRIFLRGIPGLAADRRGATVVEYGLVCAVIVLVMLVALKEVAGVTVTMWGDINAKVQAAH